MTTDVHETGINIYRPEYATRAQGFFVAGRQTQFHEKNDEKQYLCVDSTKFQFQLWLANSIDFISMFK